VRDYLRDAWGIGTKRMTIDARGLPATPSNTTEAYGQEENRRVEISSTSPAILAPITLGDTIRTATPPTIRFRPSITASAGIARWTITATQEGNTLKRIDGEGAPPATIDWRIDLESETMPRAPGRMLYAMEVVDRMGNTQATTPAIIEVEQVTVQRKRLERVAEAEIERYGLILFDFDKAELRPEHTALLSEIAAGIDTSATVIIRGYTDRTGDPVRNRQLAEQRARTAADALGLPADRVRIEAIDLPPYDNGVPDGRFYSRTVVVEVRRKGDAG
jgi:outer membrane protein OmpA-like peptidoglycan-associated protein